MSTEVKLPELGENVESGDLVRLLVKVGDKISKDQPILELETDKATIEVPSPAAGTVQEVRVKQGQKLKVGQSLLVLEDGAGAKAAPAAPAKAEEPKASGKKAPESTAMSKSAEPAQAAEEPPSTPAKPAASTMPAATAKPAAAPASGGSVRQEVKLPELGENVTGGDVVNVLVKIGDAIQKDQALLEIETDKATIEVPSPSAGKVVEIRVKKGDKVKVGQAMVVLEGAAGAAPAVEEAPAAPKAPEETAMSKTAEPAEAAEEPAAAAAPPARPTPTPAPAPRPAPSGSSWPQLVSATPSRAGDGTRSPADVPAAPSVRALAREIGVEITEVNGSGPGGRVTRDDVKLHARQRTRTGTGGPAVVQPPLPDFSKYGPIEREGMTSIRRATARNMGYAWAIPHVTQNDKADITNMEKLREKFSERAKAAGGKLTMTAIALKIVAAALHQFPKFAASIDLQKEEIIYKRYMHLGVAVDTERGLVVPVIRDVDKKNIIDLSVELSQMAQKAKDRKLRPEDLEGGVFTITNLGGIGGTFFSPIIYAPQVAILGMARSQMEPCWTGTEFKPRLMMPLSLSYDHRIIDGAETARFLRWLADAFEQPFLLALEG